MLRALVPQPVVELIRKAWKLSPARNGTPVLCTLNRGRRIGDLMQDNARKR
jgi:hypothetical protein